MKHYKRGGSSAARQIACPSWQKISEGVPQQSTTSSYAAEGTVLHTCMENILEDGAEINDFMGQTFTVDGIEVVIDDDHIELLTMALMAWDEFCRQNHIEDYRVEQTFEIDEDTGGTCDVIAWSDIRVWVLDWKFGQGVEVAAAGSKQAMFYLMAAEQSDEYK